MLALAGNQWPDAWSAGVFVGWLWLTAAFTVASGLDYVATWGGKARTILRARRASR